MKYLLSAGDEFQRLLRTSNDLDRILVLPRVAFHPVELRFGISLGGLGDPLREHAIGMDGGEIARQFEVCQPAESQYLHTAVVEYVRKATPTWLLTLVLIANKDTFGGEVTSA